MKHFMPWLATALMMSANSAVLAETNLLENPGFEMSNPKATNSPAGYGAHIRAGKGPGTDSMFQWTDNGRTGRGFKTEALGEYTILQHDPTPVLDSNTLYRYSFWYRTESASPGADVIQLNTGYSFPYHTSPDWVRAHAWFFGKECRQLHSYVAGVLDGRPEYKKDSSGKQLKDEKGRLIVLNPMKITAVIDDCELRKIEALDYERNLLENGGFETGRAPHMAPGWKHMYGPGRRAGALDDAICHSGKQSLRLDLTNGICLSANRVPVRPGDICEFSFWIKCAAASVPGRVDLTSSGKENYSNNPWVVRKKFIAGNEWRKVEFMIEIPGKDSADYDADTALLWCSLVLEPPAVGVCKIWIDDAAFVIEKF